MASKCGKHENDSQQTTSNETHKTGVNLPGRMDNNHIVKTVCKAARNLPLPDLKVSLQEKMVLPLMQAAFCSFFCVRSADKIMHMPFDFEILL